MKTEQNTKQGYSYSNQFLRMIRKVVGAERFDAKLSTFGQFELGSYHPNQRIDLTLLSNLLEQFTQEMDDPRLALKAGRALEVGQFGAASYYSLSCSSLFEVLRFYSRFAELFVSHHEPIRVELTTDYLQVAISAPFTKYPGDRQRYELVLATLVTLIQQTVGSNCIPEYCELPAADVETLEDVSRELGVTVSYSDTRVLLRYGRSWLGTLLPNENSDMRQILRAELDSQLRQLRLTHSIIEQIHIYLEEKLNLTGVTQVTVANHFNMSESSLKRRLAEENSNFKALLQGYKQTRSLALLSDINNKFESIALELGFSERASFERAFKGWYGMTPAQFREIAHRCQITAPLDLILSKDNLPASPSICQRILQLTADPDFSIDELAQLIQSDPVLTGKLIGLSNSAFYGGISKVTNLQQAITKLGVESVKNLAMGIIAGNAATGSNALPIDMRRYWTSALTTAFWARDLGRLSPELKQTQDTLFLAGLLHNIGFVLLARLRSKDMLALLDQLSQYPTLMDKANLEQKVFGVSRYSASAILLAHWGLPVDLITIIHGIIQVIEGKKTKHLASHLVYQIVRYQVSSHTKGEQQAQLEALIDYVSRTIKVPVAQVAEVVEQLNERQAEVEALAALMDG